MSRFLNFFQKLASIRYYFCQNHSLESLFTLWVLPDAIASARFFRLLRDNQSEQFQQLIGYNKVDAGSSFHCEHAKNIGKLFARKANNVGVNPIFLVNQALLTGESQCVWVIFRQFHQFCYSRWMLSCCKILGLPLELVR